MRSMLYPLLLSIGCASPAIAAELPPPPPPYCTGSEFGITQLDAAQQLAFEACVSHPCTTTPQQMIATWCPDPTSASCGFLVCGEMLVLYEQCLVHAMATGDVLRECGAIFPACTTCAPLGTDGA